MMKLRVPSRAENIQNDLCLSFGDGKVPVNACFLVPYAIIIKIDGLVFIYPKNQ